MIKYGPYELTEEQYYEQIYCNGKQCYKWKLRGEAEGQAIFHNWVETGDTFTETCSKCGKTRWIVRKRAFATLKCKV